jgi:hypothetical protein
MAIEIPAQYRPPLSEVGYADEEILKEGQPVLLDNGEEVMWNAPLPKPVMPDWSGIKSIQKYFNRRGFFPYPTWVYHPEHEPRVVKNAEEAKTLGVIYRKANEDETARYGLKAVWDWLDGSKWRTTPYERDRAFNPAKPGPGKTVIHATPNVHVAQNDLVNKLIPEVAAAVATALKMAGPSVPASVDPREWSEFQEFMAWKKSSEAVNELAKHAEARPGHDENALSDEEERALWESEAVAKGIKIDGRWSLERLKTEVLKAA